METKRECQIKSGPQFGQNLFLYRTYPLDTRKKKCQKENVPAVRKARVVLLV